MDDIIYSFYKKCKIKTTFRWFEIKLYKIYNTECPEIPIGTPVIYQTIISTNKDIAVSTAYGN